MNPNELFKSDFSTRNVILRGRKIAFHEKRFLFIERPALFIERHVKEVNAGGGVLFENYSNFRNAPRVHPRPEDLFVNVAIVNNIEACEIPDLIPETDFGHHTPNEVLLKTIEIVRDALRAAISTLVSASYGGIHLKITKVLNKEVFTEVISRAHKLSEEHFSPGFSLEEKCRITFRTKRLVIGNGG